MCVRKNLRALEQFGMLFHNKIKLKTLISTYLLMDETLGTVSLSQTASASSLSLISQANMVGFWRLYSAILSTTFGVATFGLEPPMTPGLILPVS